MHTRAIPATSQPLPVIGCGTWLGFDVGHDPAALAGRGKVLDALFAAGGRVIDTSPMYGSAEEVVGDLLGERAAPEGSFIATKVWTSGRQAGIEQMQRSMQLLRRERIELMQVHNLVDWKVHLATLREWKERGRVLYIGVTHYASSAHADLEKVVRDEALDFVQFNYSVAEREAEQRLLPLAQERGLAVLVNLPFGGGKLLKSLRGRPVPAWAAQIGCGSWNQVLLKFVLAQPAVTCVIPGTSRPEHMADNAAAGEGEIPPAAWWADKVAAILG